MRFNKKKVSEIRNYEGAPAYKPTPKLELFLRFLSGYVAEDSFYASGDEKLNDFFDALDRVAKKDPGFISKLAIFAREEMLLRTAPTLATVFMANHESFKGTGLVRRVGTRVFTRPDMFTEALAIQFKFFGKRPIPNSLKRALRDSIVKFDRYQLAKYRCDKCEVKLKDVVLLTHPKPRSKSQSKAFRDLIEGDLKNTRTWEAIVSKKGSTKEAWEEALTEWAKYSQELALIRNLRNLIIHEVDKKLFTKALKMLSNPGKNTKLYPYHYLSAYKSLRKLDRKELPETSVELLDMALDALERGVEELVKKARIYEGKVLVAIDKSGSMTDRVSRKSKIRRDEVASLYGLVLARAHDADVVLFNCDTQFVHPEGPLLGAAYSLPPARGCTDAHLIMYQLLEERAEYDYLVILTDEQVWDSRMIESREFQKKVHEYRSRINPSFKVITWDLAGYGNIYLPDQDTRNIYVGGFSEKIIDVLKYIEAGKSAIEQVEKVVI